MQDNDNQTSENASGKDEPKTNGSNYKKPELTKYGKVNKLTQNNIGLGGDGGVHGFSDS